MCSCYTSINTQDNSHIQDNTVLIIDCSNQMLTSIPANLSPDVTFLRLDGNNMKGIQHTGRHSETFSTKVLFLNSSHIEVIDDQFFRSFPLLRHLYLHDNMITSLPEKLFYSLPSLQVITLHENKLQTLDLVELKNHTEELQQMTLAQNPWTCDCDFGKPFEKWIVGWIVHDLADIRCGSIQHNLPVNSTANETLTNYTSFFHHDNLTSIYQEKSRNVSLYEMNKNADYVVDSVLLYKGWIRDVNFDYCVESNGTIVKVPNPLNRHLITIFSILGSVVFFIVGLGIALFYHRMLILVWCYNNPTTNCLWRPKLKEEVRNFNCQSMRKWVKL